jgi:hypothetical protein
VAGPCYALALSYDILALLRVQIQSGLRAAPKFKRLGDHKRMMWVNLM